MKLDITRQPFPLVLASSLVLTGIGFAFGLPLHATPASPATPIGQIIDNLQVSFPVPALIIVIAAALYCAYMTTRTTVRYELHVRRTYITMILFTIMACMIFNGEAWLRNWICMTLLLQTCLCYEHGFKRSYRFGEIFRGSFYLGLLPLIYAPAATLLLLMPAMIFLFNRPARELPSAIVGLALPTLMASYIYWAAGYDFGYLAEMTVAAIYAPSGYSLFGNIPMPELILLGVILFTLLMATGIYATSAGGFKFRARRIQLFNIFIFVLTMLSALLPGHDICSLALTAIPCSVIMPVFFTHVDTRISLSLYTAILALSLYTIAIH